MTNKSTSKFVMGFAMFVLIALALSGCGGGGDSSTSIPATPVTPPAKMSEALTLPTGHGLAVGEFTLQPGASDEYGNVVVSCPAGGNACVVTVSADGTATYDRTGGVPSVMAAYQPWNLPTGHGLAVGEFTLQPGASDEYGNVVVSCPAGGNACVVTVAMDGTATYDRTGGVPSVMAAYQPWNLPTGHGLAVGEFTIQPGASDEYGNVVVSCPAGGNACVVTVAMDGTATYDRTGGMPTVMAAYQPWNLPTGHGLAVGEFTIQPGASDERGNVVVSCPAGGNACVVTVAADGTATYDRTGGMPTVMAAYESWNLPTGHGLAVGEFTLQPGASDEYGNVVVSCPAGGNACVVTVAMDGTATYDRTGGTPTVMAAYQPWNLPTGHGLTVGEFTLQPGASDERGNVVVSCPAGGNACVVTVAMDGTATYDRTGGMPTVMAAYQPWNLPTGHGLAVGEFTLQPGASDEYGNVVVSCPAGGNACVVTVAMDGTATYDRTGGVPSLETILKIATSFGTTSLDHYPLDARFVQSGHDSDCCWQMVEAESDIVSREQVLAFLREQTYDLTHPDGNSMDTIEVHASPPVIRFVDDTTPEARRATMRAVDNINAWLPWEKHISIGPDLNAEDSVLVRLPDEEIPEYFDAFIAMVGRFSASNVITVYLGHDFQGLAGGNAGSNSIRIDQTLSRNDSARIAAQHGPKRGPYLPGDVWTHRQMRSHSRAEALCACPCRPVS